ncbi:MAG: phosphatase PAP2 family protein [Candidatus Neomarinimicrobiota bacterium]
MIAFRVPLAGVLLLTTALGQSEGYQTYPQKVATGLRITITAPANRSLWLTTGLGLLAALPLDSRIRQQAVEQGLMPEPLARFGDAWGGYVAALSILPVVYAAEAIRNAPRQQTYRRLEFTFISLTTVGVTTSMLKWAVGRERPNGRGYLSFPSGHTSLSFGVAEVVRTLYGNRIGALFYSLALVTGISRIHDNKHYLSDVVAGAGLGIGLVRGFNLSLPSKSGSEVVQVAFVPGYIILGFHF